MILFHFISFFGVRREKKDRVRSLFSATVFFSIMLSPSRIKREIFSSDDDVGELDEDEGRKEEKIELLEFERNLMLDTFSDDVLFVLARFVDLFFSFKVLYAFVLVSFDV